MSVYVYVHSVAETTYAVDLETLISVFVYQICRGKNLRLNLVSSTSRVEEMFLVDFAPIDHVFVSNEAVPEIATFCSWPVLVNGSTVVAGLCSVAREMIKSSQDESLCYLLGFREACLMACSESSIWTRFCEVDIISSIKNLLREPSQFFIKEGFCLPKDFTRFEHHLSRPVRLHNIYKVAREKSKRKDLKNNERLEDLDLSHTYGEGCFMTLADVILYPCYKILFEILEKIPSNLVLTRNWFENMQKQPLPNLTFKIKSNFVLPQFDFIREEEIPNESLYTSDPQRYKPQSRIYTKQADINDSLALVTKSDVKICNENRPFGNEIEINWDTLPIQVNPSGGALPAKRADRKREQLENLAKAVLKITGSNKYKIVDFCSGSGHLGLLLACLLPDSRLFLVENKERSLVRARERVDQLNLKNVTLLQCNLDYFRGVFDVGVSLHACGVATDLVMQNCILNEAHFVCCPCCYGGIHECYHLRYPRSQDMEFLGYKPYLSLAHAADQTHDKENVKTEQGYKCMDVIDTDRKLQAEEMGYTVRLGKLEPFDCTPKNNLLVGLYCKK